MSPSLASQTLVNAKKLGMMIKGYAWIMTSKAMNSIDLHDTLICEAMEGVIGLRSLPIFHASTQSRGFTLRWRKEFRLYEPDMEIREVDVVGVQAYDAVWGLADAIERAEMKPSKKKVQVKVLDLGRLRVSNSGAALSSEISRSKFIGLGGEFRLMNRKLVRETYEIVNVMGKGGRLFWTSAFGFSKDLYDHHRHDHEFNESSSSTLDIIWPGLSLNAPTSRLVQMSGRKYRFLVPGKAIPEFVAVHYDQERNETTFDGFSIDVFRAAIARLPYDVSVEFITFVNGSYNDVVMEVYLQGYDGAVADITINANRSQYVDFSLPYTDLGVAVVAKSDVKDPWFFLRPLRPELWIISGCLFVLTGFVV
ncbi:UNVERIFIED_CONTAM: Glutamate receptor 1.2 [Sesamum radiatum]|uniref:Glutamate receptor 1.2 n=1 Tax=Sesamum radiatum TaxID=300843 RepID=A0AAW2W4J7_SESRA